MGKARANKLSRREQQIMDVLFQLEQASVAEVRAAMEDPPSYTAVRTTMRILEDKGVVSHIEKGRKYIYRPNSSPKIAGRSALKHVVNVFFGGSLEEALAAHLSDTKTKMSADELTRLRELINRTESRKQS